MAKTIKSKNVSFLGIDVTCDKCGGDCYNNEDSGGAYNYRFAGNEIFKCEECGAEYEMPKNIYMVVRFKSFK